MKKLVLFVLVATGSMAFQQAPPPPAPAPPPASAIRDSLKSSYDSVKENLLKTAEQVPEAKLAYQPTKEVRTFGQILGHVANENYVFCGAASGGKGPGGDFEKTTKKADLQKALADSKKALAEALDLGKYVYKLNWGETKMMFVEFGSAAPILEVVTNLKGRVHWGMSNTQAGGYNSPGFATLVMQQLHKLPIGGNLDSLPRDNGTPNVGDIVVYDSGYHMFYFRDHDRREFVLGMTPFGVTALNYEFGSKRVGIIHTGFAQR
jgi:hypothetical protein